MTLKDDYLEGASGFSDAMAAVLVAGEAFVTTNRSAILTNLQSAASAGKTSFTSTHVTSFETVNLRIEGTHMNTYFAGIIKAFAAEDIYSYEVTPALDVADTVTTSIILTFTF